MPAPFVIDVNALDDPRDAVHRAVQGIAEGRLVVLPTESAYCFAASALQPAAVQKITQLCGPEALPVIVLKSAGEVLDYVPEISSLTKRLIRRCWPGPLHLRLHTEHKDSALARIPPGVRSLSFPGGRVQLTVSVNQLLNAVLRLLPGPLLLWSASGVGEAEPIAAPLVLERFSSTLDLLVDEGRCRFGQPATIVEIVGNDFQIVRPGVISEATLTRFAGYMIAVVCTGNTCRSPMAELLLKQRLAERLCCTLEELEERGVLVLSAGVSAMAGGRAAEHAVEVMAKRGLDLSGHESQPLSDRIVKYADILLTMTRGHREAILAQWPEAKERTFTIARDRGDVSDPIGGPLELYQRCADQLDHFVQAWLGELDIPKPPKLPPG